MHGSKKNLVGTKNPHHTRKSLVAKHLGKWKYRVGNYRILAGIEDENISILDRYAKFFDKLH